MKNDKFIQPEDGIHVISRKGRQTLLPEHVIQAGRERVAAGESIEDVSLDLALEESALLGAPDVEEEESYE